MQNVTVEEGRNVTKDGCNMTTGTPPLNSFWKNMKTGQVTTGKLLTISNIRRNESGEYRYTANNTCGSESTGMFIDVHCKNLYNVFIRLSNVCYTMLVSVLYMCIEPHSDNFNVSSQSSYCNVNLVRVKYRFDCKFLVE